MSDKPTYKTHKELVAEAMKNPEYRKTRALLKPWSETVIALANENHALEAQLAEYDASFKLYDDACRRGTTMWQTATGKKHVWPDTAKLVAWLLEQLAATREAGNALADHTEQASREKNCVVCRRGRKRVAAWRKAAGG